jgi:hypothetical protein
MNQAQLATFPRLWNSYQYFQTYKARFSASECQEIIGLHERAGLVRGKMLGAEGQTLRDSDIFWIPRNADTDWLFNRLWDIASLYNSQYGFELTNEMGQAQLTRYQPSQHYEWHMDLGSGQPSLRKITAVIELTSKQSIKGGGIEIF